MTLLRSANSLTATILQFVLAAVNPLCQISTLDVSIWSLTRGSFFNSPNIEAAAETLLLGAQS